MLQSPTGAGWWGTGQVGYVASLWSVIKANDYGGTAAVIILKHGCMYFGGIGHNFGQSLSGLIFLEDYL